MIRAIVGTSLKYHFLVIALAAVLVFVGATQIGAMPLDPLPEFSPPYVEIQTEALGLSAEEVEQMITVPLEQDLLAGVAWLDVIRSKSVPGLSSVVIYFEPGTDLYRARQMVAERLAQAAVAIPNVAKPPAMIQPTSSASRFMIVGLSSNELSLIDMSVLARWVIGPRFLGVPGVANVAIWGHRDQQLQVLVDPEHLRDLGVTLDQVVETTGNALWVSPLTYLEASTPGTGGFIDTPNQRLGVWHVLPISSPEDLAQVPVARTALTLGDVTEIVEDHQPLVGDAIKDGQSNLLLVIEKLPGINTLEVTRGIEGAIASLRPGFSSIDFDATLFRPATFIEMALANLTQTLVISALLLTLLLGFFFYGWRAALISLIAIPASLIIALYVLHLRGHTLNAMILSGLVIALGIIIDDAIVDVDHIVNRLRTNRREGKSVSIERVIIDASIRTRGSLFFATLIILLAIMPAFSLQGVIGSLFQPLVVSFVFAVLAGMIVALTITPVLSLWLFPKMNLDRDDSGLLSGLRQGYGRFLERTMHRPRGAYVLIAILVLAGVAVLPFMQQNQAIPAMQEPYITIRMDGHPGTSQLEMDRIVIRTSEELRTMPGVENVSAHVGRAILGDQTVGINSAELWVQLDPDLDHATTLAAIQDTIDGYPGLTREIQSYTQQTLNGTVPAAESVYTVRIFGEDHRVLRNEAQKVQAALADIVGVVDAQALLPAEEPVVEIQVDLAVAQRFGVKPGDVRRAAATLLSGIHVGSLFEEQKVFDVVVWSSPAKRQNLSDIHNLLIDTPGGGHVRLGEVADVRISPAPAVINREAVSPYLDVVFGIQGREVSLVLRDVESAVQDYPFPLEYHAELQRGYLAQQSSRQGMLTAGVLAIVGIFLLLQAVSESWRMSLAAFVSLPAAVAGGVLVSFLMGNVLSSSSLFGLFAVFGIAARNSVLLIKQFHFVEEDGETFGTSQVLRGSMARFMPMMLSTLATALALMPFIFPLNIPGHEIVRPTALVMLGGLVTSTIVNLFAMPVLYLRFGASREAELDFVPAPAAPVVGEA